MHAFAARKVRYPTAPRPPLALFETMRWELGEVRRWDRHLARLTTSAAALGIPFDPAAAVSAVASAVAAAIGDDRTRVAQDDGSSGGPLRVRLELRENGAMAVDVRPHADTVPGSPPAAGHDLPIVVGSTVPICADDPARRHKTTDRALYDAATAWAAAAGVADVLFVNEHGRVAEGAISNVFLLDPDGRWRTPPVADGALPGVLRGELIEQGKAVEAPLSPQDLSAGGLAIGNALRGLRPVRLASAPAWPPNTAPGARITLETGGEP